MSRYRPPRPPSAPYITRAGHDVLTKELKFLWKHKRPEVTRKVAEAAAMGDRSENAEYIYGKKQLREIDARIRFLSKRLDSLTVVDKTPNDRDRVYFGAWVTIRDEADQAHRYRIVGADEFDQHTGYISIDSPMARALLGKRSDDEFSLAQASGTHTYTIEEIDYCD